MLLVEVRVRPLLLHSEVVSRVVSPFLEEDDARAGLGHPKGGDRAPRPAPHDEHVRVEHGVARHFAPPDEAGNLRPDQEAISGGPG